MRTRVTLASIIGALSCLANVGAGVFSILHYRPFMSAMSFGVAGFVLVQTIRLYFMMRRRDELIARFGRDQGMTVEQAMDAYEMAQKNLDQVMKVTGAKMDSDGRVLIEIGRYSYKIVPGRIYRIETKSSFGWVSTCLQTETLPPAEAIAAVLLLLKNDPTIYERWSRQDKFYA